MPTQT